MDTFKIYRWDAILPSYSNSSRPMIYIKPTLSLIQLAKQNDNMLLCTIKNTNSIYDNKQIIGALDTLTLGPNANTPEFINREFYTITLMSYFYEYPPSLGEVEIQGINNNDNITEKQQNISNIPNILLGNAGINAVKTYLIILIISILFGLLFILFMCRKKKK